MAIFTIAVPVLAMIVAGAIDYSGAYAYRSDLQGAADAAAIGAARELHLVDTTEAQVKAAAQSIVDANLADWSGGVTVETTLLEDRSGVQVDLKGTVHGMMLAAFGVLNTNQAASATAQIVGTGNICLLGLAKLLDGAVHLDSDAKITAPSCSVFSNSIHPMGLSARLSARMEAEFICTAGGYIGLAKNFSPEPEVDCPVIDDPLASRPEPLVGPCLEVDYSLGGSSRLSKLLGGSGSSDKDAGTGKRVAVTLQPGTYCGGITVDGAYDVTLEPGEYIIKNGKLDIGGGASFIGENVGFFFTGNRSALRFGPESKIDLTAPTDGSMAGLLFWEDRDNNILGRHLIESNNARNLLGTIYLPRGTLEVVSNAAVADKSAYTVIVARKMALDAGPNLVLNTDYNATDIPVPKGVGPSIGQIALTQ